MTARAASPADFAWPQQATDVATELKRQLDQARAELGRAVMLRDQQIADRDQRIAELEVECQVLRGTLLGEAELADPYGDPHQRGAEWWHTCWKEVSRHRSELMVRVQQLERWLLDSGHELRSLQTELDRSREQNGGLARQLAETEGDFTELFESCDEVRRQLALSERTREELTAELEALRSQLALSDAIPEQVADEAERELA